MIISMKSKWEITYWFQQKCVLGTRSVSFLAHEIALCWFFCHKWQKISQKISILQTWIISNVHVIALFWLLSNMLIAIEYFFIIFHYVSFSSSLLSSISHSKCWYTGALVTTLYCSLCHVNDLRQKAPSQQCWFLQLRNMHFNPKTWWRGKLLGMEPRAPSNKFHVPYSTLHSVPSSYYYYYY